MYIMLDILMKAPAYYLMARIDFVGGSTGWHRAALIEAAIKHLDEWWLIGTDYTRHWMPTGVSWSENHSDITNLFIKMGVMGGILLTLLFLAVLLRALKDIEVTALQTENQAYWEAFFFWCIGAGLFANGVNALSVSYFDQSYILLIMGLAASQARPRLESASACDLRE
ncbi:MAG: hypothetical protein Kow00109_05860 [Acidobacteriota bacterium]